jgi:hypothetical protein|tara:strand:+ start:415 stop:798 length:384 start_codon:yes stop_codon:yes gene_type:complete
MTKKYIEKMKHHLNGDSIKIKYDFLKNDATHTDEEIKIIYPDIKMFSDLIFEPHKVVSQGLQSKLNFENGYFVSVVGGGVGLYGDGVTSFEVGFNDISGEFDVVGHLSTEEVTELMVDIQSIPKSGG